MLQCYIHLKFKRCIRLELQDYMSMSTTERKPLSRHRGWGGVGRGGRGRRPGGGWVDSTLAYQIQHGSSPLPPAQVPICTSVAEVSRSRFSIGSTRVTTGKFYAIVILLSSRYEKMSLLGVLSVGGNSSSHCFREIAVAQLTILSSSVAK